MAGHAVVAVGVAVVAVALAGCLGADEAADDLPLGPAVAYVPVDIQVREPLVGGFAHTRWGFAVGPGAEGHVEVRLEAFGPTRGVCFQYEVTQERDGVRHDERGSQCGGAVSVRGDEVLYSSEPLPGTYRFSFSAEAGNAAAFVADIRVSYP